MGLNNDKTFKVFCINLALMTNHLHTQLAGYRLTAERGNHAVVLKLNYFVTGIVQHLIFYN